MDVRTRFASIANDALAPLPSVIALHLARNAWQNQHNAIENMINDLAAIAGIFRVQYIVVSIPTHEHSGEVVLNMRHERAIQVFGKLCIVDAHRYTENEMDAATSLLGVAVMCAPRAGLDANGGGIVRPARGRGRNAQAGMPYGRGRGARGRGAAGRGRGRRGRGGNF